MKKKTDNYYTDESIMIGEKVEDFLPSPEELRMKEDTKKVTIALTKRSIDYFKTQSRQHNLKYQVMIREIIDRYVTAHS